MAEFASKGVAGSALGLGIAGLSVALLNNGGLGGGLGGILGGGATNAYVDTLNSKIAELQAEKYADKTGIEVYKAARESDAKTNSRFEEIARTIADMRVREAQTAGKIDLVAATANQGIAANSAAITCLQNTVAGITKIVVPNSSICPGWGNVTITPATATTAG
nr:MAG TPA: hypothetical protein [Bacteriophage sp.]